MIYYNSKNSHTLCADARTRPTGEKEGRTLKHQQSFDLWRSSTAVDEETRAELNAIVGDDAEIYDRFYRDMAFGTGGMRGLLGAGTNRINRYTVRKATLGFARYLKQTNAEACDRGVVIAHDNRRCSRALCLETAGVLAAEGIKAFIFENLHATPQLSFAVRHCHAAGGVVITASHNPPEYNGYKVYDKHGCQLTPKDSDVLIRLINEIDDPLAVPSLSREEAGERITVLGPEVDEAYYDAVMGIRLRPEVAKEDLCVVYSPQHGTGNVPVREVLARCGYRVTPVEEQCFPNEDFVNTKNPNPESASAFEMALDYARRLSADLIITTDPDCDRLGVAVREGEGYVLMTGNQTGAVLLEYILSTRKEQGTLPADGVVFNTIVTSNLGDRVCADYGVRVEKTLTGFKFIGDKIHELERSGKGSFLFGYEESYGYLISDFARDKDAVQASLMLCEAAAYYKKQGKTLYSVLQQLYERLGYCLDSQISVVHKGAAGVAKIASLLDGLRNATPKEAAGIAVTLVEDYLGDEMQAAGFPSSNVLRFLLADGSWVAIRPSGTEPKCKYYYCVAGRSRDEAERKLMAFRSCFER